MQTTEIFNRLIDVAKYSVVIQSVDEIKPDSRFVDHLGFDSLDQIEVLMDVEEEFGIEISDEEAETIVTVGDAVALVQAKLMPNAKY